MNRKDKACLFGLGIMLPSAESYLTYQCKTKQIESIYTSCEW